MNKLQSRKLWVALLGLAIVLLSPLAALLGGDPGMMIIGASTITGAYLGGQSAVDAMEKYKNKDSARG